MVKNEAYNLIFLDTNIYRQMGLKFYNHTHYKNLAAYCTSGTGEICVAQTVLLEYLNFYESEIQKHIGSIEKASSALREFLTFRNTQLPDLESKINDAIQHIKKKINPYGNSYTSDNSLNERQLIDFLLFNKKSNKDNTRDFLIWLTILTAASKNASSSGSPYRIILISNDKIFSESPFLAKMQADMNLINIEVYESISNFLSDYTHPSPHLNINTLLSSINRKTLEKHLLNHRQEILREVSYFYKTYYDRNPEPEIFAMGDISMETFYSGKHSKDSDIVHIYGDIVIKTFMVFEAEKDVDRLKKYLTYERDPRKYYPETFDATGRPVFDGNVSCITYFNYSISKGEIVSTQFHEIIPYTPDPRFEEIISRYKQQEL